MTATSKDKERLKHIRLAIQAIEEYTNGFSKETWQNEPMRYDATLRQLEIVGEASNHLSNELIDSNPDIPWHSVAGFRNIVVHEYFRVDEYLVWNIIQYNLPLLKAKVESLLGN
jgi:uncharacterized protein with HEPN domain